jgi:hypothetical protein
VPIRAAGSGSAGAAAPPSRRRWDERGRARPALGVGRPPRCRRVAAGTDPWLSGWNKLVANSHSRSTWTDRATATAIRGGTGENYSLLFNDIAAAYQNALRRQVGGTEANAACAARILNAWSTTLTSVTGNADRFLAVGIYGRQFASACELVRGYSGFDLAAAQDMLAKVFYSLNNSFLTNHNDACITNYWANWDLCNMASVLAIGILNEDSAKYDQAVTYFKSGAGNGSIAHAVPYLYTDSHGYALGQWQESGRDQGHTLMGMGRMGAVCEMAWNQGDDLYSYDSRCTTTSSPLRAEVVTTAPPAGASTSWASAP